MRRFPPLAASSRWIWFGVACLLGLALPADASKTRLRLERVDASDFSSDGVVRVYASIVELEGQVVDDRPGPAFELKLNGKKVGKPIKAQRFQGSGDPLDLVLIVESSAMYGAKPATAATPPGTPPPAPPPPPKKGSKIAKGGKGAPAQKGGAQKGRKSALKMSAAASSGDEPLDKVKGAVSELLEGMPPTWRVFLFDYGGDVTPHRPFRAAGMISGDIDELSADGDAADLKLIDAINAALIEIKKERDARAQKNEKPARALIVLVSDGLNYNMDKNAFRTAGGRAAKELVPIHTLAFSPMDDRGPLLNLGELSKLTNGTFRWAKNGEDLRNQIETLADELNKQYVLTFKIEETDIEKKTFQLMCGDLTSNPLKFGGGFAVGGSGKRGLGWWWLLIGAGILLLLGLILMAISRSRVEYTNFSNKPQQQPQQPAAAQPQAAPQQPKNAMRIGDPEPAPRAAAQPAGVSRGTVYVLGGALAGTRVSIAIGKAPILVGKGPATLQILDDPTVSTRHAQVSGEPYGIVVTDLGSTNGTFVNNQRIGKPTLLQDGDLVRFGNTQIKFRVE